MLRLTFGKAAKLSAIRLRKFPLSITTDGYGFPRDLHTFFSFSALQRNFFFKTTVFYAQTHEC